MNVYWDSYDRAYRHQIARAIERLSPRLYSVLEVGCNAGPNLRLWRSLWPGVRLMGCDISPEAIAFARQQFVEDPLTVVWESDFLNAALWIPSADVVVSCYSVAYASDAQLERTLARLYERCRLALVLAEPTVTGPSVGLPTVGQAHDYVPLLTRLGANVLTEAIPEPVDGLNAVHIARRKS